MSEELSPKEVQRGTRKVMMWSIAVVVIIFLALLATGILETT